MSEQDRARGALWGLAVGDALGMPTQSFTRAEIVRRWGMIGAFQPGPPAPPSAPGRPAGSVTDDTEQAVLLGRLFVSGRGRIDPRRWAQALSGWEQDMRLRGSLDLLGPTTRRAVEAIRAGREPAALGGTTNGAAMRIAPVGVAVADPDGLAACVREVSRVTHGSAVAIAAAGAVAATVSAGVGGAPWPEAVAAGVAAADQIDASLAELIARAVEVGAREGFTSVAAITGTSLEADESVPAAFGVLVAAAGDAWQACCLGASIGGDTDTIAAMAGAMAGSCQGTGRLRAAMSIVGAANGIDLDSLADQLLELRRG